jgi:16S rRNA (cytidine1402-2'-O)-methyltransferase
VNPARRVISYFEGNEAERERRLADALRAGRRVAVISEAGMPGSPIRARAVAAAIAAARASRSIPARTRRSPRSSRRAADRSLHVPRLSAARAGARRELFGTLRGEVATLIFYEAPDRVGATLADLAAALGAIAARARRELTKLHEEHVRGTLGELAARYATRRRAASARSSSRAAARASPAIDIEAELRRLLDEGSGPKDAAARLVVVTGKPRRSSTSSRCRCSGRSAVTAAPILFEDDARRSSRARARSPCGLDVIVHPDDASPQVASASGTASAAPTRRPSAPASRTCSSTCSRARRAARRPPLRGAARAGATERTRRRAPIAPRTTRSCRATARARAVARERSHGLLRRGFDASGSRSSSRSCAPSAASATRDVPRSRAVRDRRACTPRATRCAT